MEKSFYVHEISDVGEQLSRPLNQEGIENVDCPYDDLENAENAALHHKKVYPESIYGVFQLVSRTEPAGDDNFKMVDAI